MGKWGILGALYIRMYFNSQQTKYIKNILHMNYIFELLQFLNMTR